MESDSRFLENIIKFEKLWSHSCAYKLLLEMWRDIL